MKKTDLQVIPGIGESMERHLVELGYSSVASLKHADPQALYDQDCILHGCKLDPCVLYVYRLAVYFASHKKHDPEKLNWWYWKNPGS